MALKKILVVSNTYSMPDYPAKGLYVKEQALCLVNGGKCIIDVLYIKRNSAPFMKYISLFIRRFLSQKIVLFNIESQEDFSASYFFIPINRRIPDNIQLKIEKFYIKLISKFLATNNQVPDLIHAHSGLSSGIFSNWISKYLNVPFVLTEHSPLLFHFVSRKRGKKVVEAFEKAKFVATLSTFQNKVLKRISSQVNSLMIPNFSDNEKFEINLNRREVSYFTVISVLYTNPVKGRKYLFESFKILKNSNFDFRYIIVGEGIEQMKNECKELGIIDLGEFYFNLNRSELAKLFNRSKLFISSSVYETFGMAAREAMLCGIPVLTTDNGGIVDSINEDTGLVVPVQNAAALAEGVQVIYNNYHNYESFKIREQIVKECGKDTFRKKMYEFYGVS
jgi:glycosyltransferase involved in cell wall biosynthesis